MNLRNRSTAGYESTVTYSKDEEFGCDYRRLREAARVAVCESAVSSSEIGFPRGGGVAVAEAGVVRR
jgi:hypothetical protein